jgi:uncharacterized protein (TIGR03067 family)
MRWRALLLFTAVLLLPAAVLQDDAAKKELDKLQGSWTATEYEYNGNKGDANFVKQIKLICKDDKYTQKIGDEVVEEGTHKLDPTKKPKTMDITVTAGQEKGKTQLAIYELEGDTFKICAAAHGAKERPKEFTAKAGSGQLLIVLKRDKD